MIWPQFCFQPPKGTNPAQEKSFGMSKEVEFLAVSLRKNKSHLICKLLLKLLWDPLHFVANSSEIPHPSSGFPASEEDLRH